MRHFLTVPESEESHSLYAAFLRFLTPPSPAHGHARLIPPPLDARRADPRRTRWRGLFPSSGSRAGPGRTVWGGAFLEFSNLGNAAGTVAPLFQILGPRPLFGPQNAWPTENRIQHLTVHTLNPIAPSPRVDLRLLANLNCGTTYSSELARRLGVSRQAVGKLVKNLEKEGLVVLETDPEQRNLKRIVITPEGERWIRAAVGELQRMEQVLAMRLGEKSMAVLRQVLEADWGESAETSTNLPRGRGQSCGRECAGI